jgi:spermidine/putrescine transport system substrate-binding protein
MLKGSLSRREFCERTVSVLASFSGVASIASFASFASVASVASVASTTLSGCSSQSSDVGSRQLNIFSWADYLHPDCIPEFEKRYGLQVTYDTFSGNEQLLAKLQAGATEYDIVMPSNYMVQELQKLGKLAPLQHDRLKGLQNLMPRFQNPGYDRGLAYSVPQFWGTSGIACDTAMLEKGQPFPDQWEAFWDKRFANRMTLLDDARETIGMSLKKSGKSYNSVNFDDIKAATQELITQKALIMCYTSDQVIVQLTAEDSMLAMAYSGDAYQAARQNKKVQYRIPKGGASVWVDSFCIPNGAPHVENAYKWLNYMLEPAVSAKNAQFTRYATANLASRKFLSAEEIDDPNRYPSDSILSKCEELQDLGKSIFLYDRMWTELKCS